MAINEISRRLKKSGISLKYKGANKNFNSWHWNIFVDFYGMKSEEQYAHDRSLDNEKQSSYVYSQQAIEAVFDAIKQDPDHVIDRMKEELDKKRKPTPGAKDSKQS